MASAGCPAKASNSCGLADTSASPSATAKDQTSGHTGYGSEYAFGKAFKREYGIAPGQYRKSGTAVLLAGT
uniref:helix-turn-helix domain-containing protein n=1 Tax=Nocardia sp. XZ_19_385 TaxID=2769488 RepID=UPI002814AA96|nr:AraC family transcriptional regulator [Nocardia sp. XZ_19_385]